MELQWWCAAQGTPWEWTWRAYPGVWIFMGLLVWAYRAVVRKARAAGAVGQDGPSGGRAAAFGAGLVAIWLALDWPIGALGAGYLASAHMVQFLLIGIIAPPLLIWGIPPAALEGLNSPSPVARIGRLATMPLIAIILFNLIIGITHTPKVSDALMATQIGSFVIDIAWIAGGLIFWWPVFSPVPERPIFHELLKIVYITAQAICMTPWFLYLTFSGHPVYRLYELSPPVHGLAALDDQRMAGLIMKVGGGLLMIGIITVLFFRWAQKAGDDPAAMQAAARQGTAAHS